MTQSVFSPIAVDLFAGCGGLSEGFAGAGFTVAACLEKDPHACETLRSRVMFHELKAIGKLEWYHRYLRGEVSREDVLRKFSEIADAVEARVIQREFGEDAYYARVISRVRVALKFAGAPNVHVLLGGPPCQAYSLVGRSRDPDRMEDDERHFLYQHYLDVLTDLQPDFFVLENVPGLLTARARGEEIFQKMLKDFAAIKPAYEVAPSYRDLRDKPRDHLLDSADFHVPQHRKRVLLIGYRRELGRQHPGVRDVFIKLRNSRKRTVLTVDDAIGDLPRLKPGEGGDRWYREYSPQQRPKPYQALMRRLSAGVCNHRARSHMQSDLERYKFFIESHKNGNRPATLLDLLEKRPDLKPKHEHLDKFLDRFKVQWWTQPSATVMSHIAKDGHYYIHPDINQCRSFTVREAARCQSFPDNFFFEGPRTEQFRQVGNAVPPRMAAAVARVLMAELREIYRKEFSCLTFSASANARK
jgi:DNA (cytosine-5)-methyltransferase 1